LISGALAVLFRVSDASTTEIAFLLSTGGSDYVDEVLGTWHGGHWRQGALSSRLVALTIYCLSVSQDCPACGGDQGQGQDCLRTNENKQEQRMTNEDKALSLSPVCFFDIFGLCHQN